MTKQLSKPGNTPFEQIKKLDGKNNEYWTARDMAKVLEYSEYRHFLPVVARAQEACKNSGHTIEDHFEDILDMVGIGSGAERSVENIKLSRYACYLIVQNADPSKEVVALGQTYFAVQTRLHEIQQMEEYNRLSTEDEKRLFLRNEMTKHNTLLAAAAKKCWRNRLAGLCHLSKPRLHGFVWRSRCQGHSQKERPEKITADTRPYGQH